ncbi:hypothetical protein BDD12DRAFT_880026 [Trichophaea hybrida]|nr:hypothetical protein BDD12DRAFT_880026 [Trichophaea hybrida]
MAIFNSFRRSREVQEKDTKAYPFSSLPPPPPPLPQSLLENPQCAVPLQKYHLQTYIICFWITCLFSYFVAVERAIRAYELLPGTTNNAPESYSFGCRGTKRGEVAVQAFNVGRTILTVAHRIGHGRELEDGIKLLELGTYHGNGGVLASFAGFPIATLGYLTVSEQYWDPVELYLPKSLKFNDAFENVRNIAMANLVGPTRIRSESRGWGTLSHIWSRLRQEIAQVVPCVRPTEITEGSSKHGVQVDLEIALRINSSGTSPSANASSPSAFSHTKVLRCSEIQEALKDTLSEMFNITVNPALTLLHQYFNTSNQRRLHAQFRAKSVYAADSTRLLTPKNFSNALIALANSFFITTLPYFISKSRQKGFSYQTDVKLERGFIPITVAPLVLLTPVLIVAWMSMRKCIVSTWAEVWIALRYSGWEDIGSRRWRGVGR